LVAAISETLNSRIDRPVRIESGETLWSGSSSDWPATLRSPLAMVRGSFGNDLAGGHCALAIETAEAITLAGYLMLTPEEVINEQRLGGTLEKDQTEALGEIGNVVCSAADTVLRTLPDSSVKLQFKDQGPIPLDVDPSKRLGATEIVAYNLYITIGDYPRSVAHFVIDSSSARKLNANQWIMVESGSQESNSLEEDEEDIPQAPIRGKMAAYIVTNDAATTVRRCGRRVGIEIHRHAKSDIPNPAAHRNGMVLLEIPVGEDKRFEWAKRIKSQQEGVAVVLLVHEPSRQRVVHGFMTNADIILAWPSDEGELSAKLRALLDNSLVED
jgi:hypothetical protein